MVVWWEAKKSVSKGAVQAPLESLLGDIHSIELVRRASSRDTRVSRKEEDYCGGRRLKAGWMKLPAMVKFDMHRRETRSLKSRRGAFLRQSSTFFDYTGDRKRTGRTLLPKRERREQTTVV